LATSHRRVWRHVIQRDGDYRIAAADPAGFAKKTATCTMSARITGSRTLDDAHVMDNPLVRGHTSCRVRCHRPCEVPVVLRNAASHRSERAPRRIQTRRPRRFRTGFRPSLLPGAITNVHTTWFTSIVSRACLGAVPRSVSEVRPEPQHGGDNERDTKYVPAHQRMSRRCASVQRPAASDSALTSVQVEFFFANRAGSGGAMLIVLILDPHVARPLTM